MRQLSLLLFILVVLKVDAQQSRFVILQSSPNEPFYVRIGDLTYSSTSFGQLLLAPLKDSAYLLSIGFPRNKLGEREFHMPLVGSDRGFDIKRTADGGFRLFEWQKNQFLDPLNKPVPLAEPAGQAKTDGYSKLMAGVVDDPAVAMASAPMPVPIPVAVDSISSTAGESLKTTDTVNTEQKSGTIKSAGPVLAKADTLRPVKPNSDSDPILTSIQLPGSVKDSISADSVISDVAKQTVIEPPTVRTADSAKIVRDQGAIVPYSRIDLTAERSTDTGRHFTFLDITAGVTDTIGVFIGKDPETLTDIIRVPESANPPADSSVAGVKGLLINSDCVKFASEADVDKLRILILKAGTQDDKINEAKKAFRSRCFTVRHIRGLSELFTSDEGRYQFFDAAYPFVSDSGNFRSLINLLNDRYYVKRFKAMVRMPD